MAEFRRTMVMLVLGATLITFGIWWLAASGSDKGDMPPGTLALWVGLVVYGAAYLKRT